MLHQLVGWGSSAVLVATIGSQILSQWREKSSEGVSPFLFVGQFVASCGLLIYSLLGAQWVFVVLNAIMAVAAMAGLVIWFRFRDRDP